MNLRSVSFVSAVGGVFFYLSAASAEATCILPYVLTNGQTADATQVMGNFNTVTNCLASTTNFTGGFLNKFRNATMDIWQRGTSISAGTAGVYTADGWFVQPTGAAVTVASAAGIDYTVNSLQITGAASVTDVLLKQPIESYISAPLSNQPVTVQFKFVNNTGGPVTPTLTVKVPSAQDNYASSTTIVSAAAFQACTSGSTCLEAYTFTGSASSNLGTEIIIDFGNNFSATGKSVKISDFDIRVTAGISTGPNSTPPAPELRPVASEMPFSQRYYERFSGGGHWIASTTGYSGQWVTYKATKRSAPTVNYISTLINYGFNTPYAQFPDTSGVEVVAQATTTGTLSFIAMYEAVAEIAP